MAHGRRTGRYEFLWNQTKPHSRKPVKRRLAAERLEDRRLLTVLPAGWTDSNINSPAIAGDANFDAATGALVVSGAGNDIFGSADQFNFAYKTVSGDSVAIVHVDTNPNTDAWSKAGLMFRSTTGVGSRDAGVYITPANGVVFEYRTATNASTSIVQVTGVVAPKWLELIRTGNSFSAYYSANGTSWTQIGAAQTISGLSSAMLAGLAVTSHNTSLLHSVNFSGLSITNSPPTIVNGATASPANPSNFVTNLSALGADLSGANNLKYTWSATSLPSGAATPSFSANGTNAAKNATATFTTAGLYTLQVSIVNPRGMAVTSSVNVNVNVPLPSGWTDSDIGGPGVAGSAGYTSGTWTVSGGGGDIWNANDQFNFARNSLSGNGSIVARVASQTNTDTWAKSGLMFRNDSSSNSAFVDLVATPGNGIVLQTRDTAGNLSWPASAGGAAPIWLKLTRGGSNFTGYYSNDGVTWILVGSLTSAMNANVLAGLAVTSHNNAAQSTATFSNVAISVNTPPTIASPAAANPSPVVGTSTGLNVLGASSSGESVLTYTWTTLGTPPGPVSFSQNGTNAAKNVTASFLNSGNYTFRATVTDDFGVSTTSDVTVNVTAPLGVPAGLIALRNSSGVGLTWQAASSAVSYNVYRAATSGGEGAAPLATGITQMSFTDATASQGTNYYYQVTSVGANNAESARSFEAVAQDGVDILSYHGGTVASNGVNDNERQITPSSVTVNNFAKQFGVDVTDVPDLTGIPSSTLPAGVNYSAPSGQVYAEPLVKTGVTITTGLNQGIHDVVFVGTSMNSLFAIDANGGTILWKDSFIYNAAGNTNPLNANIAVGVTAVPGAFGTETNSQDIAPWIGIVSTPVIDAATGYLYVVAKTREARGDQNNPHYVLSLHKIRIADGFDTSTVIADTSLLSNGNYGYNSGPYTVGNGVGSITVNGESRVYFNAVRQMVRPALELYNGRIYVASASHGDNQPYHGWVLTYDANTLACNAAWNSTPNGYEGEGGIWQGGGGVVIDSDGFVYFETGNGAFDGSNNNGVVTGLDANGFPINGNYGDCFVKIALDPTTSQGAQGTNKNGWGLKTVDYFSPYNNAALDSADRDLGSGGPIVLPDSAGSAAHPHLLVGAGKEGKIYLIDRDNMGKFGLTDNVVQTVGGAINASLDVPAYFNNRLYYTAGYGGPGSSWTLTNGAINIGGKQNTPDNFGFPGSSPYITANGTQNGVVWMIDRGSGQLRAYDASNLSNELWTSNQNATRDSLGAAVKFSVATPANGRVYVGTADHLWVYGPPTPPTAPPAAPSNLAAIGTGASTIQIGWSDNANNEDGFRVERSSDGVNFSEVAVVSVNATNFVDSGLSSQATYYYRVRSYNLYNFLSYSNYSNVASAATLTVGSQAPVNLYHLDENGGATALDSAGFNPGTLVGGIKPTWTAPGRVGNAALTFSGSGTYNANNQSAVQVANNLAPVLGGTSSLAAWIKTTQIGNDTQWQAPGITGVEQSGGGNDIGWGILDATGHIGVYVGDGGGVFSPSPINDGAWHHVAMSRDAGTGMVKLYVDGALVSSGTLETGVKSSQFKLLGARTDVDGDGVTVSGGNYFNGSLDDIRIYNEVIDPVEVVALALPPAAATGLTLSAASGTEIDLSWTDVATTENGYEVWRSVNVAGAVRVAQLPADSTGYLDGGLTQGTPYDYFVRAVNTAGFADSMIKSIVTPTPPLTPSACAVTFVSTTIIDVQWTDNANNEQGYKVLRRTANGNFAEIAQLGPNATSYHDTGVVAGTAYDYHVQAYNIAGYSDFTGVSVDTITAAPTGFAALASGGQVSLSWTAPFYGGDPTDLTFNVYRGSAPGAESATPIVTGLAASSFVDASVASGQTYYYKVSAVDPSGISARSNEASVTLSSTIVGRYLFYNNSYFDTRAANASNDNAIASDKSALLAGGGQSTFANVSSYSKGINGVMIDIAGLPTTDLTASDFIFHVGNTDTPNTWALAAAPSSVVARAGQGVSGSTRIEIVWPDGALKTIWLSISVQASQRTGLAAPDTFYFGNAVADSGLGDGAYAAVNASDEILARNPLYTGYSVNTTPAPITLAVDFNRDGNVNATDQLLTRVNFATGNTTPQALKFINVGSSFAGNATADAKVISASATVPYTGLALQAAGGVMAFGQSASRSGDIAQALAAPSGGISAPILISKSFLPAGIPLRRLAIEAAFGNYGPEAPPSVIASAAFHAIKKAAPSYAGAIHTKLGELLAETLD